MLKFVENDNESESEWTELAILTGFDSGRGCVYPVYLQLAAARCRRHSSFFENKITKCLQSARIS